MSTVMKMSDQNVDWFESNRNYLVTHIDFLKYLLHISRPENTEEKDEDKISQFRNEITMQKEATSKAFALDYLCQIFALSEFEKYTLLIAIGKEFDSSFLKESADKHGLIENFSLALAILPDAEWDALLPNSNLRKWGLVSIKDDNNLTHTQLHVAESIIHFIAGMAGEDELINKCSEPLNYFKLKLSKESQKQTDSLCQLAVQPNRSLSTTSFFTLTGECEETKRNLVSNIGERLSVNIRVISSRLIPSTLVEIHDFILIWERETLLNNYFLYIECENNFETNIEQEKIIDFFVGRFKWPVIIGSDEKRRFCTKDQFTFEVKKPSIEEQKSYWEQLINDPTLVNDIAQVASHFDLNYRDIKMCCSKLHSVKEKNLWNICRNHSAARMDSLAEKIMPSPGANSLILPERETNILKEIVSHVKFRSVVYQSWGLLNSSARSQGISVLFSGASGTGKTTAAEYLALKLNLDLYRIELSSIVSKYIGETEKNLQKIFAAAEKSGAILLFDEADALFSKRTQVNNSNDRHANVEVSYLLQRMESFKGLAILTSNLQESIDKAFLRRLRFIIQFPFPSKGERELIWKAMLPEHAPSLELDFKKLAQLNVAGGNIRNITMNACFFAAASQEALQMKHYLKSSRDEYLKLEKNLSESEVRSWV